MADQLLRQIDFARYQRWFNRSLGYECPIRVLDAAGEPLWGCRSDDGGDSDAELGRLVESTVWVNEAHPAYRRAAASRSEGYHIALAVAMALAPLAVEPVHEHHFVTAFLAQWGRALELGAPRRKRSRRE